MGIFEHSKLPSYTKKEGFMSAYEHSRNLLIIYCGGEGEIRTLGTLLTYTRFPIVLLRPARTPLRMFCIRAKPKLYMAYPQRMQAKSGKIMS